MIAWLSRLIRGRVLERQLDAELLDHVERQTADYVHSGMEPAEARRQALIAIGGLEQMKEQCREARGTMMIEQIGRDIMFAIRQIRRQPAFWSVVVVTLVVGIATSTSMFAIVNGVLLRPLPYHDPDRLVSITDVGFPGVYLELRQRSKTMDIGAFAGRAPVTLTGGGEPTRLAAALADAELFDVLGVAPRAGRRFLTDDTRPGAASVVILSYGLWQERFAAEPTTVGQPITLDGIPHTVIGVMAADFQFPSAVDVWLPLVINPANSPANRIALWANAAYMVGRLRVGAGLGEAGEEVRALVPPMRELFPWRVADDFGRSATAVPLLEQTVRDVRPTVLVLFGSVVAVLLILCVNVANLLLSRGLTRERELAIRTAIGATRARLVRQLVIESLTVSLLAGGLGTVAAVALLRLTVTLLPSDIPRVDRIAIDGTVLAFSLGVSLLTGILFGVLPALRVSRGRHGSPLRQTASSRHQASERRASRLLAAVEIALAVMLVVSAALFSRSLWNLLSVDPGFRAEQLVTANVVPPRQRYGQPDLHLRFVGDLLARLRGVPGVRSAAAGSVAPFVGLQFGSAFAIEGRPDPETRAAEWPLSDVRAFVTPGYLDVLGVPILEGRAFADEDRANTPGVIIVSRSLARAYWGETSPVGTRVRFPGPKAPWLEIVGVAADIKWNNLGEERNWASSALVPDFLRTMYVPMAQAPGVNPNGVQVLLRTDSSTQQIAVNLRDIVRAIDADTPVSNITTGAAGIAASVARPRFTAFLLALFAGVALFLGAIGVYGVLAYAVGRRTQEFAVRLALGANPGDVLRTVLGEGARLTITGLLLGIAGALLATRALSRLLFGVAPTDPGTFAGVATVLVTIGLLASWVPARRAMRVDPTTALQSE